jgi:methionyl-tRNA formyltransferase
MRVIVFASGEVGHFCVRGMLSEENRAVTHNSISLVVTTAVDAEADKIKDTAVLGGLAYSAWENLDISLLNEADLILLLWWPHIIKEEVIAKARRGAINLHPSLLPYNRGKHPYYWAIVDGTPFGVSIHCVTPGIDDGPVMYQKEIPVPIWMSGGQLYKLAKQNIVALFLDHYSDIVSGNYTTVPQDEKRATFHLGKQLKGHSTIDLDRTYTARELINIIRGRSYGPGMASAQFRHEGKTYSIQTIITEEPG